MFKDFWERLREGLHKFFSKRYLVLGVFLIPLLLILVSRFFFLQVIRGEDYLEKYQNTTRKEISIPAIRGNIYDVNGKLLAGNQIVYHVTLTDENYYTKSDGAFNEMLLRLIGLLEKYDVETVKSLPVTVNAAGIYQYSGSGAKIRTFIRDVYGKKRIDERAQKGEDAYLDSCETVMNYLTRYLYNFSSKWPKAETLTKEEVLKICHIRYALSQTAYTRYISTKIATDVSETVRAAILESQNDLYGVNVEEAVNRVYYNAECFSSVLGYVGSITTEEIEELNAQGGDYIAGDVIGKEGIEAAYESNLQGEKGKKLIYVNSTGMILYEEILEEPKKGNDVYLSIDADTTVAAYHIVEQQLAGVVYNHLYEGKDYDPEEAYENDEYKIPIRAVYFQMINNNILDISRFDDSTESAEQRMEQKRVGRKSEVLGYLSNYLESRTALPIAKEEKYDQAYIRYLYTYLTAEGYLDTSLIDTKSELYRDYKNGDISFPYFLTEALKAGWADLSALGGENRYDTVESCYALLRSVLLSALQVNYGDFDKLIYDELIHEDRISGCEVALALFSQGILKDDPEARELLTADTNDAAFLFFQSKIQSMELTPAQIALDPCSAGVVITNPNSGELRAVVSYPGYDSNRINDSAYYAMLLQDQSSPLYSRATQSRLAPGSTFKMVTSTAALEGGYVRPDETIVCEGIFDKLDHPRCWIYRLEAGFHGHMNVISALGQSCNCFFYECGYRFSQNKDGLYSPSQGVNVINDYAKMYGFGSLTGIETAENISVLTNELPVTSAIGQGTNAFTTISVARYVTAIASSGNVYEFKYLNRIEDNDGNVIMSYTPAVLNHLNFKQSTWDFLHQGMYMVVHDGGSRNGDFAALRYQYAGKSGTAQENRLRAEQVGGQAVLGRQIKSPTPWLTGRHGYDPTSKR